MEDDSTHYGPPYGWTQVNISIEGVDYSVADDVSQALVGADHLWNDAYDATRLPFQEHLIPAAAMDIGTYSELHQDSQIPQISPSTVQHNVLECNQLYAETSKAIGNSAWGGISRASGDDVAPTHVNASNSIVESYAFTHKIAERNRRNKINQQFLALHSILPRNSKKDKQSVLSEAILQLNHLKLRKRELELRNQVLMETLSSNITNVYSSSLHGEGNICGAGTSATEVLMRYIADEAVVVIEESNVPNEAIMKVTLKKMISSYMDIIIPLLKCLRELKLEVLRIECGNMDSMQPVIQVTICTRTKEDGWQISERKNIEGALKRALSVLKESH